MKPAYLFEFMDQTWLPRGLRQTLREILECISTPPFRCYYRWVAQEALHEARRLAVTQVVELGAGTARITATMAAMAGLPACNGEQRHASASGCSMPGSSQQAPITFVCCDNNPDRPSYEALVRRFGALVRPIFEPVDMAAPHGWGSETLLVLSAALHHIPHAARAGVLHRLCSGGSTVLVCEPLRRTIGSMLYVLLSIVPALVVPARFVHRPGRLRRVLWCWLLPAAPLLFCWDGIVSCLRQWTKFEWERAALAAGCTCELEETLFCQRVAVRRIGI